MIDESLIVEIKKIIEELLQKMTIADFKVEIAAEKSTEVNEDKIGEIVNVNLNLKEPQFLIGRDGQTLLDLQKILRVVLNKKLQKSIYLKLDINDYQKQKIEYLKNLARSLANEVVLNKEEKSLPPMPAYERRIIHEELAKRQDVISKSQGNGTERYIIISPR